MTTKQARIAAMIETLRAAFGKIDRMDPEGANYKRLCAILDRADNEALIAAANAKIAFVSSLALNRCLKRGLIKTYA